MSEEESDNCFKYTSSQHSDRLVSQLRHLLERNCFTDITLAVGKNQIQAHRLVLCAASPYFEAMFMSGLSESDQNVVEIHGVAEQHLQLLMDFIYSGEVLIDSENVQELLAAADLFQVGEVVEACCSFLKREFHPTNCLGIMNLADAFSCLDLSAAASIFSQRNFIEVVKQEEFLDLSIDSLLKLLNSEYICIEHEFQVFEAGLNWILHNPSERRQSLVQILECIRFPLIQPTKLFNCIETCQDFSLRIGLGKLLEEFDPKKQRSLTPRSPYSKYKVDMKPRHSARKYLVILGGYHRAKSGRWHEVRPLADVYRFDSFSRIWTPYPNIQYPRSGLTVVCVKGFLYAIGGENELLLYDNVEVLDPLEMKWRNGPSLPCPLSGHNSCVIDGFIYTFGGYIGSEVTDNIIRLDPEEGKWINVGSMPTQRTNFALTVVDGLVYVAGGSIEGAEKGLESYNPITGEWTQLAHMKHSRGSLGMAAIGNYIYAVGGARPGRDALQYVERYSIEENKWTTMKSMRMARADPSVASINGLLFVVGGRSASHGHTPPHTLDSTESYNPETNTWTEEEPIPTHRCDAGVVVM